ncbi:MAG TPA: hypothetical protein ENI34_01820 [candidate division WOR-3 bacterium]|uniref:Transposase IS200-like domain-containing protein n=1 Tax=candidate division WOR-3 bacterium TaxID=2052148 RepID=A0A9C9EL78_UNCW3|nr:hypothetical protein [candidate division WOR-3 bacterium]
MARSLRIQFPGAVYYITCRGMERRRIFLDDRDRSRFLELLLESSEIYQIIPFAYIMLSDHFHLLIQTRRANCSEFMRHFNIRYTSWFNRRYGRCGSLYQGRYQAFLVDADTYLLEVSRYLHLSIVRLRKRSADYRGQWRYARHYRWSSLGGYLRKRYALSFINYDFILSKAGGRRGYRNFMIDGLKYDKGNPFEKVKSRFILGDDKFVVYAKQYLSWGARREQSFSRNTTAATLEPTALFKIFQREYGISRELFEQRGAHGELRGMAADLLYRYCGLTQVQIGSLLGRIDYVSVHQLRRRLKEKMVEDIELKKRYEKIESKIKAICVI